MRDGDDGHGFSFTATEISSEGDPLGTVSLTKDPTKPHETAAREAMFRMRFSLHSLGLGSLFQESGSTTIEVGVSQS